jgi:3-deoxy-D-manno-octulosonic-acid transferase
VIVLETEIWPNFIRAVSRLNLPLFLVNARLSDRSYRNYYRTRRLFAPLLNRFTAILAQSPRDRERFAALGVDDARLQQTGNLKFDSVAVQPGVEERRHWRHFLRLEADDLLLVAGSTFAGEEILLARIVRDLRQSGIPLRLLIAPRHIERVPAIQDELSAAGFSTVRRSAWEGAAAPGNAVMLLDTIGELRQVYAAADAVFIGKSLTEQGGQNPIEPAAWGKPVLFGPNMQNFRDVAALLLEAGGARQVGDETELQEAVLRLCQSPAERQAMGQAGQAVVRANQGALQQIMNAIQPVLQAPQAPA